MLRASAAADDGGKSSGSRYWMFSSLPIRRLVLNGLVSHLVECTVRFHRFIIRVEDFSLCGFVLYICYDLFYVFYYILSMFHHIF